VSDIGEIEESVFWQGKVVHLTKGYRLLTAFIVPWYFGSQRTELIRAIRLATGENNATQ